MRIEESLDPSERESFEREAAVALSLGSQDNLASVFEVGEHEGRPFFAMDRIEGVTLAELSRRVNGPWSVEHAVAVVVAVLRALRHVHGQRGGGERLRLIHREVTPHNIMVSDGGVVTLLDFGMAQRVGTPSGMAEPLGMLSYVPREQVEGGPDERSDLFAVGALLFELLDGRRFRWHCADDDALFEEIYRDRMPTLRRDVPYAVRTVLQALLQPERERRVRSAEMALKMLEVWWGYRSGAAPTNPGLQALYREVMGNEVPMPTDASDAPGIPRRRRRVEVTVSAAAPAAAVLPCNGATAEEPVTEEPTRVLAASEQLPSVDPTERELTRFFSAAVAEEGIPTARRAAEAAVTRPTPSRHAPWSADTDPLPAATLVRPEPGAPRRRTRARPNSSDGHETSSASPRSRESVSMHRVAAPLSVSPALGPRGVEHAKEPADESLGDPVWRLGSL